MGICCSEVNEVSDRREQRSRRNGKRRYVWSSRSTNPSNYKCTAKHGVLHWDRFASRQAFQSSFLFGMWTLVTRPGCIEFSDSMQASKDWHIQDAAHSPGARCELRKDFKEQLCACLCHISMFLSGFWNCARFRKGNVQSDNKHIRSSR